MNEEMKEILAATGNVVEDTGRMLQRNPSFSLDDLAAIQKALSSSAKIVKSVKKMMIDQHR